MKVNYFREMKEHHMVIAAGPHQCPDYQMNMMKGNAIPGLLVPVVRQMNGEILYDYSITGCQSLQTFTELEPISEQVLTVLVRTLGSVLEEMERYLVDGDYLALRPEFIYLEVRGGELKQAKFCFFPFLAQTAEEQMRELLKYVLNEVDYQEKSAVNLAYELFQQASQEDFLIRQLSRIVEAGLPKQEEVMEPVFAQRELPEIVARELPREEVRYTAQVETVEEEKNEGSKSKKRLFPGRINRREREIVLSDILK